MQCVLYGIIGYRTHKLGLMNREPEPEERAHFQPAAGDSVYIKPNQTSQQLDSGMLTILLKPGPYRATFRMRNRVGDSNIRLAHPLSMLYGVSKYRPLW